MAERVIVTGKGLPQEDSLAVLALTDRRSMPGGERA